MLLVVGPWEKNLWLKNVWSFDEVLKETLNLKPFTVKVLGITLEVLLELTIPRFWKSQLSC
jgi:hypothetical protein